MLFCNGATQVDYSLDDSRLNDVGSAVLRFVTVDEANVVKPFTESGCAPVDLVNKFTVL